ncbi:MAG: hypothetical protein KDK39_07925 [Leptospiraceae bacterium]|nr:hypothetical protein [Leptospiraceae bacterium]
MKSRPPLLNQTFSLAICKESPNSFRPINCMPVANDSSKAQRQTQACRLHAREALLNANPARSSMFYDGWQLRFGFDKRPLTNCILTPGRSYLPLHERIQTVCAIYHSMGHKAAFLIDQCTEPADLDRVLTDRGFQRRAAARLALASRVHPPDHRSRMADYDLELQTGLDRQTGQLFDRWQETSAGLYVESIVSRSLIVSRQCWALIHQAGQIIAGLHCVLHGSYAVIQHPVTHPAYDRSSLLAALLQGGLDWAANFGIATALLTDHDLISIAETMPDSIQIQVLDQIHYRVAPDQP